MIGAELNRPIDVRVPRWLPALLVCVVIIAGIQNSFARTFWNSEEPGSVLELRQHKFLTRTHLRQDVLTRDRFVAAGALNGGDSQAIMSPSPWVPVTTSEKCVFDGVVTEILPFCLDKDAAPRAPPVAARSADS